MTDKSQETLLETVEVETGANPQHSVIWLHGLGADGHDFEPIVPELGLPSGTPVRFVFPHAPVRPVTLNMGMAMRAWFDIISLDREGQMDEAGIRAAEQQVHALIARENDRGVETDKIVIAGFSQGGSLALHTGTRYPQALAGIMGLSTWLPLGSKVAAERSEANEATSIFMAHGSYDPVIQQSYGEQSRDALLALGYQVAWHSYPIQHQVSLEEIREIGLWLTQVFGLEP